MEKVSINNPQEVHDRIFELKEQIKKAQEEIIAIQEAWYAKNEDYESPILVDGKEKYFRVYEPDGRYVYNIKYDIGVRVTPKKVKEAQEEDK